MFGLNPPSFWWKVARIFTRQLKAAADVGLMSFPEKATGLHMFAQVMKLDAHFVFFCAYMRLLYLIMIFKFMIQLKSMTRYYRMQYVHHFEAQVASSCHFFKSIVGCRMQAGRCNWDGAGKGCVIFLAQRAMSAMHQVASDFHMT